MLRCARNNLSSRVAYDPVLFASAASPFPLVSASHPSLDCAWENKRDRQVTAGQPYSNARRQTGRGVEVFILASRGVTVIYWEFDPLSFSVPLSLLFPRLRSSTFPPPLILSRLSLYPFSFISFSSLPFSHSRSSNSVPFIPSDSFYFLSLAHRRVVAAIFA